MSNPHRSHLPPEILDCIVDHLHDEPETLKQCCLVSKSWVPRSRKHLFANILFYTRRHPRAWKEAFPDLSRSPVHYTHTLAIDPLKTFAMVNAGEDAWAHILSRVLWSGLNVEWLPQQIGNLYCSVLQILILPQISPRGHPRHSKLKDF